MREVEGSGASVDEAVDAALAELGASREDVDVEVLSDGRSGFLGVGGSPAVVRVTVRESAEGTADAGPVEGPSDEPEPSTNGSDSAAGQNDDEGDGDEWLDDQADLVADFLEDLFDAMDLPAEVEPLFENGTMYVDVWAGEDDENLGILIGRHGAALDALQEIV